MDDIDLTLVDWQKKIKDEFGCTEWITVFSKLSSHPDVNSGGIFSALIANYKVEKVLEKYDWDLLYGHGLPGFVTHYQEGKPTTEYYRHSDEGIEPLVYWRMFSGRDKSYFEISEEFRLYFDLYEDRQKDGRIVFIATNDDGEDDEVIVITDNEVKIKLKYIKIFLAVKKMHLAIFFEMMRFSDKTLEELNQSKIDEVVKNDSYIYSLCVRHLDAGERTSQGWLLGKKLIEGATNFQSKSCFDIEDEKYEDFIVGVNSEGNEEMGSCNADYHTKPHFLTPVFFKREVLKKYYDSPEKFEVQDGHLSRKGFWGLRMCNNSSDNVMVWLGDLKALPHKEQTHWKSFNITPKKISHTDYARNIMGEFTDPEHPELYFKYRFSKFQKSWKEKFGWDLFKPLSEEDDHHLKSLHVPTTTERKEFDEQVASLTKIIIDSLNEQELAAGIGNKDVQGGISKLEAFLNYHNARFRGLIDFLRNLQKLRSTSIAHRKSNDSKDYIKAKEYFDFENKDLISIFEDMIIKAIWIFNSLDRHFKIVSDD